MLDFTLMISTPLLMSGAKMPLFPSETLPDLQTLEAFIARLDDYDDPIYHDVFCVAFHTSQPVNKVIALNVRDIDANGSWRVKRGRDIITERTLLLDERSLEITERRGKEACNGVLFPSPVDPCKPISSATVRNAWTATKRALNIKSKGKADPLDPEQAQQFRQHLEQHYPLLYLDIWDLQMDTQQRISDVLPMNTNSIKRNDKVWAFKTIKNAKSQRIPITGDRSREVITRRLRLCKSTDQQLLFPSPVKPTQPITAKSVGRVFKEIGETLKLPATCGTHTPRKTGAYLAFLNGVKIAVIMKLLGHSNIETTMVYLGITDADVAAVRAKISAMI